MILRYHSKDVPKGRQTGCAPPLAVVEPLQACGLRGAHNCLGPLGHRPAG